MSKKPIKSNLFRFVTLRSPQLIEDKEAGFVSFPEGKGLSNKALTAIDGVTGEEEKKTALLGAYKTDFSPYKTRLTVKAADAELYRFSLWLRRNKSNLSFESITNNLPKDGVSKRIENLEEVLWDQLFNNIINKGSTAVREAIIQVLIGHQFLERFKNFQPSIVPKLGSPVFTKEEKEEFTRRANASVIIPKGVVASQRASKGFSIKRLPSNVVDYMGANMIVNQSNERLQNYQLALKEVENSQLSHDKKEELRYSNELGTYKEAVKNIQDNAVPELKTVVDSKTGFEKQLKTYPNLELPQFDFVKKDEITRNSNGEVLIEGEGVTKNQFSSDTLSLLNSEDFKTYNKFSEVTKVLKEKIKSEHQTIITNTPEKTKTINVKGESVEVNIDSKIPLYSYYGTVDSYRSWFFTKHKIELLLRVKDAMNLSVVDANYSLSDLSGVERYSGTSVFSKESNFNSKDLLIVFFPERRNIASGVYKMKATFTLSDNTVLEFEEDINVSSSDTYINGQCLVKTEGDSGEDSQDNPDLNYEEGILHGVSQLGIADYRRVEQELCCYVPGEVSHIENVMAREYKERSTRNLLSSEQTTERTSEKEVENLTDTTSTERNELQSETSLILNKDNSTNFGANASVSGGGFIKFSAGVNYGTSSSNSASSSNSQAQTYAQEVTERALERVVQKVSTKRTSRILREFEENNTHGFDNRKGDNHVSGVYRWVDKIYKNKLINYGKRLMYEFALPEPSKYFVKSYLEKSEDNQTDLITPRKPILPSELPIPRFRDGKVIGIGIMNATDINEGNYQDLASRYNADINAIPERYSYVGESFTRSEQQGDGKKSQGKAAQGKIRVPKGYKAVSVKTTGKFKQHSYTIGHPFFNNITVNSNSFVQVSVAGLNMEVNSQNFTNIYPHYLNEVPVSVYYNETDLANINVLLKCERTEESYEKWQNETYKAIMDAYNERLHEYNEFVKSQEIGSSETKKKELSSDLNRAIEKRELKRIAIDLMASPFKVSTSETHYKGEDYTKVLNSEKLNKHAQVVKFFEQAFDWEIMAYIFYPYFYGEEGTWEKAFDYTETNDPIFKAFLQSGMARSVVPVRPGFEEAVNWYMKTGEIWNGQGMVTDMDDDLYVSIAEEMQTLEGEVEETWETRVPTTLTVLQADSVVLNEGGLPCNPDCEGQGLFESGKSKIGDGLDGVDYDTVGVDNNVA